MPLGIAPFYLYANVHKPWMCPVCAFAIWWLLASQSDERLDGFVFRKKVGSDGVSINPMDAMVCQPDLVTALMFQIIDKVPGF